MTDLLSCETRGSGPGLVLLRGTTSTGLENWGTVIDQLAAQYTVVLPNLPGSDDSPLPDGPLDIDTVADQIVATVQAAGVTGEFVVAGVSLGAPVAIKVTARHPRRIRGLVTVMGYARPRTTLRLNLELWASLDARGADELGKFLTSLSFSEEYLASLPAADVEQIVELVGRPTPGSAAQIAFALGIDVHEDLRAVRVPTLVVVADRDRFVAPAHSVEIAEGIAGARLVHLGGGHASLFEEPRHIQEALLGFLEALV